MTFESTASDMALRYLIASRTVNPHRTDTAPLPHEGVSKIAHRIFVLRRWDSNGGTRNIEKCDYKVHEIHRFFWVNPALMSMAYVAWTELVRFDKVRESKN